MFLVKGSGCLEVLCFAERHVAEHGKEHVEAAPRESDEGLVVTFALSTFPVGGGA